MSDDQDHILGITSPVDTIEADVTISTASIEAISSITIDLVGFQQQPTSLQTDLAEQRAMAQNSSIARREDAERISQLVMENDLYSRRLAAIPKEGV